MNHTSKKSRSYILCLIMMMIVVTVFSGFSIVWMQQQISRTAQNSQKVESELAEVDRRLGYVDEKIATLHQPVMLQSRVSDTLRPSLENQIVWVRERQTYGGRSYTTLSRHSTVSDVAFSSRIRQL